MDAFPIAALKLVGGTGTHGLWLNLVTTLLHQLIGMVLTIGLVVTDPDLRDTLAVIALELIGVASEGRALPLIAAIATVIITIADKYGSYAGLVAALELAGRTNFQEKEKYMG